MNHPTAQSPGRTAQPGPLPAGCGSPAVPGQARTLRLKRGEERRIAAGHPWVFSNEVDTAHSPLTRFQPGEPVQVADSRGRFLGQAYVNPHALICARIVSREPGEPVDGTLIAARLAAALLLRRRLGTECWGRVVYGESDGLPGLVLDRFGTVVVGQIATWGMEVLKPQVEAAVRQVLGPEVLYWKNDSGARELEQLPRYATCAFGAVPGELAVREGALAFAAPLATGQKTGWFYDQTANRARLARHLWPGARVLDVCSYAGAWAVTALAAGAGPATCVDASEGALEFARRNAAAAGHEVRLLRGDAFEVLRDLAAAGERFDAVVLDPPAFIKRRKDQPAGQAAYRKLNQLALELLDAEGLLVSCSCSYHLAEDQLTAAVQAAARHAGRCVQVLEYGGQSPDHPVHPAIPETRYLKALFCRVTRG
ncbi:MAG TPA: class I SAM-dependent rRNA methyltransferase [Steroidobacteraceae bacterium]|nr:class I SAM-dependent rRNA methyltransferase [Steroidobacteraceae bacterium]